MHSLLNDWYNPGGAFMFIHVSQTVVQFKAHFTKFKHISPQTSDRSVTCFDCTCSCSQTIKQYIAPIFNTFRVESLFYSSNFFRRNLMTKMWWTYALLGIVVLYRVEAQVTPLEYSTAMVNPLTLITELTVWVKLTYKWHWYWTLAGIEYNWAGAEGGDIGSGSCVFDGWRWRRWGWRQSSWRQNDGDRRNGYRKY